jgi:hypothetical protein
MKVTTVRDVEKLLSVEQMRQLVGCQSAACATDLAAAVEGEQVVTGSVAKVENEFVLTLARIRTRDAVVLSRWTERAASPKALLDAAPHIARKLFTDHAPPPVTFQLRVLAQRLGTSHVELLKGGENLRQGDRVAFEVDVSPACHVYLLQRTRASGALNVLFPSDQIAVRNPIPSFRVVRIPDGNDWFEIDNEDIGVESVFIVASPFEVGRLSESVSTLESTAGRTLAERALTRVAQDPSEKCKGATLAMNALETGGDPCLRRTRGLKLASAQKAEKAMSLSLKSADHDDTVMAVFLFEHVAAP